MGSFHDDYEDFEELSFDEDSASRRSMKAKHRRGAKAGGRQHKQHRKSERWDAADWDELDEYEDYNDLEFDAYYKARTDH